MYLSPQWRGAVHHFLQDEEGAQVVEYALIIAVVSIALVLALQGLAGGQFADFITRVSDCL
ncbi:Flp family type IVb pilin, partial [Comamonas sp. 17RB]|uniref:Flp family type IVb pilin n=1 Tax=Comamonas sp. 17RB TaxID=3047025 RepID=UPI0024B67763